LFGAVKSQRRNIGGRYIARARGAFAKARRSGERFLPGDRAGRVDLPHNFATVSAKKWLPVASCH
jgi:hypothetical protein